MKYIKTYEKLINDLSKLKKYIVVALTTSDSETDYFIDTIINISSNDVTYTMLYHYQEYNKKLIPVTGDEGNIVKSTAKINNYLKRVIFSSDNLDDCLDFINMREQTTKYNL